MYCIYNIFIKIHFCYCKLDVECSTIFFLRHHVEVLQSYTKSIIYINKNINIYYYVHIFTIYLLKYKVLYCIILDEECNVHSKFIMAGDVQ